MLSERRYVTCEQCGASFRVKPSERRKYCSRKCVAAEPRRGTLVERFLVKIDLDGPIPAHRPELGRCHLWLATKDQAGYGQLWCFGKLQLAHRVAWFLKRGIWPQLHVLHHCDNPACVNVAHLFEGTDADNIDDMLRKGRARTKLDEAAVLAIRGEIAAGHSHRAIAARFGVSQSMVSAIGRRESWRHL
jgi:hypothetical protein